MDMLAWFISELLENFHNTRFGECHTFLVRFWYTKLSRQANLLVDQPRRRSSFKSDSERTRTSNSESGY